MNPIAQTFHNTYYYMLGLSLGNYHKEKFGQMQSMPLEKRVNIAFCHGYSDAFEF